MKAVKQNNELRLRGLLLRYLHRPRLPLPRSPLRNQEKGAVLLMLLYEAEQRGLTLTPKQVVQITGWRYPNLNNTQKALPSGFYRKKRGPNNPIVLTERGKQALWDYAEHMAPEAPLIRERLAKSEHFKPVTEEYETILKELIDEQFRVVSEQQVGGVG